MAIIGVTNNGSEPFSAKYDGKPYDFPPGEMIPIQMEAAQHIFGLGKTDKLEVMARHGRYTHTSELPRAYAWLNSFSFGVYKDPEPEIPELILAEMNKPAEIIEQPETVLTESDTEHGSAPVQTGEGAKEGSDGLSDASLTASSEQPAEGTKEPPVDLGTFSFKKKPNLPPVA